MRNRYVIANWKMNLPPAGVDAYLDAIAGVDSLIIAPPFPFLKDVVARSFRVAAQNCSDQRSGAFTGEVSPLMLRDCGVAAVILGHSERRNLFGERDALVAAKLELALSVGLLPIVCIGEDLAVRDAGNVEQFLAKQLEAIAPLLDRDVVIAYEPIWAIGTGRNASGVMVSETVAMIRKRLPNVATSVLYGGSVTPDNVADLVENGDIDGFLVGGASLDAAKFLAIRAGLDSAS
ncbi:MAG TPA: triose-phosphate isomerase [Thermoanaerobaculia bacterium]|nr:triose-phosphate isomerase [Thermoanaerobaculia bacterium]